MDIRAFFLLGYYMTAPDQLIADIFDTIDADPEYQGIRNNYQAARSLFNKAVTEALLKHEGATAVSYPDGGISRESFTNAYVGTFEGVDGFFQRRALEKFCRKYGVFAILTDNVTHAWVPSNSGYGSSLCMQHDRDKLIQLLGSTKDRWGTAVPQIDPREHTIEKLRDKLVEKVKVEVIEYMTGGGTTLKSLREHAKRNKIRGYSTMDKATLIRALQKSAKTKRPNKTTAAYRGKDV